MDKKKLLKIINSGASSESDLQYLAHTLNIKIKYIGSIYNLKNLSPGYYILLLSPNKKVLNGHWVALKVTNDLHGFYFDSYGMPSPQILVNNLHKLYYNTNIIQDLRSSHCGLYSIYYLYYMNKFKNPDQALNKLLNHFINH